MAKLKTKLNRQVPQSAFNRQHDYVQECLKADEVEDFLYRHQVDAVKAVCNRFSSSDIALVVLPTGCGKSGVAVLVPYALNASKVLVITPSLTISEQIYDDFCGDEKMFLFRRGMLEDADDIKVAKPDGRLILNTREIRRALDSSLVVANAQKFGANTNVDIGLIPRDKFDLVIVDEAHHYPAITWQRIVDHFPNSRRLFLTATPYHSGDFILPGHEACYELTQGEAVQLGIIRKPKFEEEQADQQNMEPFEVISRNIQSFLDQHDQYDDLNSLPLHDQPQEGPARCHQAMVLTVDIKEANRFAETYNALFPHNSCAAYHSRSDQRVFEDFQNFQIRVLVVVKKLLEGYDRKYISVVGIARRVASDSKVLFAQFVGRAVRKLHRDDPVPAMVLSHTDFNQKENFLRFDKIAEEDPVDEQINEAEEDPVDEEINEAPALDDHMDVN